MTPRKILSRQNLLEKAKMNCDWFHFSELICVYIRKKMLYVVVNIAITYCYIVLLGNDRIVVYIHSSHKLAQVYGVKIKCFPTLLKISYEKIQMILHEKYTILLSSCNLRKYTVKKINYPGFLPVST